MAYIDEIKRLSEIQKQQALSELEKTRQANTGSLEQYKTGRQAALGETQRQGLSTLESEQAKIAPAFYEKRGQESTASQLQAKNFAEYLASRNQARSGVSSQAELMRNAALQGNIGALNRQELASTQDVERRRTDVGNTYQNALQALNDDYNLKLKAVNDAYQSDLASRYGAIDTDYTNKLAQYQLQQEENARQEALRQAELVRQEKLRQDEQVRQDRLLQEQRAYEQQQNEIAYQRQLALDRQKQASSSAGSAMTYGKPKQTAQEKQQTQEYQAAIQGLQAAAKAGQAGKWARDYREEIKSSFSPEEQKALLPGGYIYKQMLKGD